LLAKLILPIFYRLDPDRIPPHHFKGTSLTLTAGGVVLLSGTSDVAKAVMVLVEKALGVPALELVRQGVK
jgi:hypothetical protein